MPRYTDATLASWMFKSESRFYVFVLLFMDGKQRNDLLGVIDAMYRDPKAAEKWRDSVHYFLLIAAPGRDLSRRMIKDAKEVLEKLYEDITYVD